MAAAATKKKTIRENEEIINEKKAGRNWHGVKNDEENQRNQHVAKINGSNHNKQHGSGNGAKAYSECRSSIIARARWRGNNHGVACVSAA